MTLVLVVYSFLLSLVSVSGLSEFYCRQSLQTITGVTEGVILTREQGTDFYANNLQCSLVIDAGQGNQIQLVIEDLDLQWSPEYTSCEGYDNLQILEGPTEKSPVLTTLCHARNPYSIITKRQHLYLTFTSDNQNFYNHRGIRIRFSTFKNETCAPGWFQVSPFSLDCLMVGLPGTAEWTVAQDNCNFNRANLASVLSEAEQAAIQEHGRNISSSLEYAWIGLNDRHGSYSWIDQQTFSYKREIAGKRYNTHCIAQDFTTGNWHAFECNAKHNYICKAKKDGSTELYQADPASPAPEQKEGSTKVFLIVIIVVVLIALAAVGSVIFYCFYWRKRKPRSRRNSPAKHGEAGTEASIAHGAGFTPLERQISQPSAPSADILLHDPQQVAPPTYEESQYHVMPANY